MFKAAGAKPDLYDEELLYWHQDFRVLLAMRYVTEMAKQYGVRSDIPPLCRCRWAPLKSL